jgi:hypothetical protein
MCHPWPKCTAAHVQSHQHSVWAAPPCILPPCLAKHYPLHWVLWGKWTI